MGGPAIIQVPGNFCPATVLDDEGTTVVCMGHDGIPLALGYELTLDPVENWKRAETLRQITFWYVSLVHRGIDPDSEGLA